MRLTGWWVVLTELQLVLAGFTLSLALQQVTVWRWEGRRSPARFVALSAFAASGVFATNVGVLRLSSSSSFDAAMWGRTVFLCLSAVSLLPLAASVTDRRPPRRLTAAVIGLVLVRVALWPTTRLIYEHRQLHGLPVYGPLLPPLSLAIIVGVLGYLWIASRRGPTTRQRVVLTTGVSASVVLAALSIAIGEGVAAEMLTGYVALPALAALAVLIWLRQNHAHRTVARLASRQHSLATLGQLALVASLPDLVAEAQQVAAQQLGLNSVSIVPASDGRPIDGASVIVGGVRNGPWTVLLPHSVQEHDEQFLAAVASMLSAAAGRQQAEDELVRRATHDELTGLPNRGLMHDLIDEALEARSGSVAVALCDIDRFKSINDVHGHPVGDDVLVAVAERLSTVCRHCDTVGRFGGDEFVVLCRDAAGSDSVEGLGERIRAVLEPTINTARIPATITASIGIVVTDDTSLVVDADTLLRDADTAMHDAKTKGGAAIGRFHHDLRSRVVYRADIERHLVEAVSRGEIPVHYQPVVNLSSGSIVSFEALARWRRGDEVMAPAGWIPVAESTGLIHEIGEHVLGEAVNQLREWLSRGFAVGMSINVSARQLSAARFFDALGRGLVGGPPPSLIGLEVTESLVVDDRAVLALAEVRELGLRIALDDFGTGYSSLAVVARLPVDTVKIDQSIVNRVTSRDGEALVAAVLAIARSMGLTVIAEGVETDTQRRRLIEMGCDLGQGYLFGRPLDAPAATRLLEEHFVEVNGHD